MASSTSPNRPSTAASAQDAAVDARRANAIVAITGSLLGTAATVALPVLSLRPNRVVDGLPVNALEGFGPAAWLLVGGWIVLAALATLPPGRWLGPLRGLAGIAILSVVLASSGSVAARFATEQGPVARTSFAAGFYTMLAAFFLVQFAATADTPGAAGRAAIFIGTLVAVALIAWSGAVAELGIVREWQLASETFDREFRRYLFYALGSTAVATTAGVPLGIWAARDRRAEVPVMGVLNIGQVFPALAFIGIMMPILGGLAARFPGLKSIGISGIGWAPVFIVLVVYALFPIARNTLAAIRSLDPDVLDAARGMGMSRSRSLFEVELPLAFPVVLAGIRVALVQGTAGSILAALVGGGGLGAIVFFGLEQTSMDLVLVGVIPIVTLAFVFDSALRALERMAGGTVTELV
jgi:osmoprotectant transport system permease protein